ncbi:MAG: hypothetical protein ACR2MM_03590 [Flavobacteriaceae bacterium]
MRKIRIWILAVLFAVPMSIIGQDAPKMYWVHEDQVKPSMIMEYEKSAKQLVENCQKHNIQTLGWITTATNDHRYLYVSPISSMADINYDGFDPLVEAMGEEAFGQMFSDMDKCYTSHGDYIIVLNEELTYMPEGFTQTPEGEDYRRFYYINTTPEHNGMLKEKMKAIKEFYASKSSKVHYRVYQSGFGTMGNYYMVAVASKDGISFETMGEENRSLLGDERHQVFSDMMKYVTSIEEVTGMMRRDLAYSPKQ